MDSPTRYLYSLIRCVPDPRTGEFVNIAAIAGDPESEDWSLRQVSSENRVRRLADVATLTAVHSFLAQLGVAIDDLDLETLAFEDSSVRPSERWLSDLYRDHRNVVQLSPPTPILASSAEEALDVVFGRQIIDPVAETHQRIVTKHRVLRAVRLSYNEANINPHHVQRRPELHVGDRVHTFMDYAIANGGGAVQLSQCWSFQGQLVDAVSEQVKAWGYAVRQLRDGEKARLFGVEDWQRSVEPSVDLEVVVTPAMTPEQQDAYGEALQVFSQLDARVHDLSEVAVVGLRAAELLYAS